MLQRVLKIDFDRQRLQALLMVIFLALAIPTGVLIWHAYSQLKWEAFHQYRTLAEEFTQRIDTQLIKLVNDAEARSFADYSFLIVTGDPSANFLQRSPLAAYPVNDNWPGLVGYFQIDTNGKFSTPLLPGISETPESVSLSPSEYASRQTLANKLQLILGDNRLVQHGSSSAGGYGLGSEDANNDWMDVQSEKDGGSLADLSLGQTTENDLKKREDKATSEMASGLKESDASKVISNRAPISQVAFDSLSENQSTARAKAGPTSQSPADELQDQVTVNAQKMSKDNVANLKLDSAYEKRSAQLDEQERVREASGASSQYLQRQSRKERSIVPAPVLTPDGDLLGTPGIQNTLRIKTFESELDPFEFSLLDKGQIVLFRKVWRDGQRYIQGMLLDQEAFIQGAVDSEYRGTALSSMSDLILANQNEVLHTAHGSSRGYLLSERHELEGTLLYRNRLSAPFSNLELIFSVNRLPPGPGADVLSWVTLLLTAVFIVVFYALYRAGLGQIALVQQQHDFVSAVSHELKTPLTSIRMYGEMLKEGWADDEKKQTYYEFIHDESERLTRLISNVLQLANISRADPQIKIKPVSVPLILNSIESKVANQVQQADFELEITCDSNAKNAQVMIDEDCFIQVIINLFDNAIKFSRHSELKKIELGAKQTSDGKILFSVRDFGPGIAKDQMEKIFEMFYRSESELTRETVGTGIGLAIVHQLSKAMKGKVDVMNREPGAEFRVILPVAHASNHS